MLVLVGIEKSVIVGVDLHVITLFPVPVFETATNKPFPYVTLCQALSAPVYSCKVQVIPSLLVITLFPDPVPVLETATNIPFPYVTLCQSLSAAEVREVQVIPSGLVITLLVVPEFATATNNPFPYVTLRQLLSTGVVLVVHIFAIYIYI